MDLLNEAITLLRGRDDVIEPLKLKIEEQTKQIESVRE
jgi:hypothetical protein